MLRTLRLALFVSSVSFALAACGNKGPLVLPDKTPAPQDKDAKKDSPAPPSASPVDGPAIR